MGNDFIEATKGNLKKGWDARFKKGALPTLFDAKRPPLCTLSLDIPTNQAVNIGDTLIGTPNDKGEICIEGERGPVTVWPKPPQSVLEAAKRVGAVPMKVEQVNEISGTADVSVHDLPNE